MNNPLIHQIAGELALRQDQVAPTLALLGEGATIPFIARYRKEATRGLDEVQIAAIQDRNAYLVELGERKRTVLAAIEEQGKLDATLRGRIEGALSKQEVEDLYLPYKKKRKTKGDLARDRGLGPLAERAWAQEDRRGDLLSLAAEFVSAAAGVDSPSAALEGAGHILAERIAHDPLLRSRVRDLTWQKGRLCSQVRPEKAGERSKFEMYFEFSEALRDIPSHRLLAMRRGEEEEVLRIWVEAPEEELLTFLEGAVIGARDSVWRPFLQDVVRDAYRRLLAPSMEVDARVRAKEAADVAAIDVFAENLKNLLLDSPAGQRRVLAIDPGFRTGCKVVVLGATGDLLEWQAIYPHPPQKKAVEACAVLTGFVERHRPEFIVVGNGTAGRETETLVRSLLGDHPEWRCTCLMVSEAGASVYSASEVAREEFPELDVSVRGAVSIGRRFQDPLAELVKIDAKSIGVGQYQHDVSQLRLKQALDRVVASCVNSVGVDLNTASPSLLQYVSGVGPGLARAIVARRSEKGPFMTRKDLLDVPRLGPKAFEQAAGFLRITGAGNPLDASAVHPERYDLVRRMAADLGCGVPELIGDERKVASIQADRYVDGEVGLPTLRDIFEELKKPGRDPRQAFDPVRFREGVETLEDLAAGMQLPGVVTNVTHFGAFVDVGVHQDGLVHVSELADRFVRDPADVVKVGQKVAVRVLSVDLERKRIALSMKSGLLPPGGAGERRGQRTRPQEAGGSGGWKDALSGRYRVRS